MAKLNPFLLPRLERVIETRSFFDAASGETLSLTLRAPNASEQARASEIAQGLITDFITGNKELGRPAAAFPAEDVEPSETLFRTVAMIEVMQPHEAPDRYPALELAVLSARLPLAWREVMGWYLALLQGGAEAWGKSPGAPTASSAEPRSSIPAPTP